MKGVVFRAYDQIDAYSISILLVSQKNGYRGSCKSIHSENYIIPFFLVILSDGKRKFARSHCFVHGSPDLFSIRKSLVAIYGIFPLDSLFFDRLKRDERNS